MIITKKALNKSQKEQMPKIMQITPNLTQKFKLNPMTYNPHQTAFFKGNISRIMRRLRAMHSCLAHTHFMHISHFKRFTLLAKQEIEVIIHKNSRDDHKSTAKASQNRAPSIKITWY